MSIQSEVTLLASAPATLTYHRDARAASATGAVLYFHGFDQSKEDSVPALMHLADAGFLAVGLDAIDHGERGGPTFHQRTASLLPGPELEAALLTVVRATAQEVPSVIDALERRGLVATSRVGVAGWSMGGFIAYTSVVADRRIRAAVPMLGSPEWRLPWPESPHRHRHAFFPTALLSQTAQADTRVPPHFTRTFHQELMPLYAQRPERLQYIEYEGIGHAVSGAVRKQMYREMVAWFIRHLGESIDHHGYAINREANQ